MKVWINEKKQVYFCVKICFPGKIEPIFPTFSLMEKGNSGSDSGLERQFI